MVAERRDAQRGRARRHSGPKRQNIHGRSRQTFVQYKDDGFPNVIHFFYNGVTDEEAGIADKMIESLQLNGAPAAQK